MRASIAGALDLPPPLFDDTNDPGEDILPSQVRLRRRLWDRLTRIAQAETEHRVKTGRKPPVISRNDVIERFLERCADEYEAAEAEQGSAPSSDATPRRAKKTPKK